LCGCGTTLRTTTIRNQSVRWKRAVVYTTVEPQGFFRFEFKATCTYRVSQKNATPHKMLSICRYICYIIYWLVLLYKQCNFTQLCKVSLSKSKWLFHNSTFTNITQKSLCTGFGKSTIVNANTTAWHLLQKNPFTTKVSAAKPLYVLNLSICYPKIDK